MNWLAALWQWILSWLGFAPPAPPVDRTPLPLTGAFISLQSSNVHEDWETCLTYYPFRTLILMRNSHQVPDRTEDVLTMCRKYGISVFLGLAPGEEHQEAVIFRNARIEGWYLPEEIWGVSIDDALDYNSRTKELSAYLKRVQNLPVMCSPIPSGRDTWTLIFRDRPVDIIAIQGNNGASGSIPSTREAGYRTISDAARSAGIVVWGNVESFDLSPVGKLQPTSPEKLRDRITALSPYCDKLVTFDWWHYLRHIPGYQTFQTLQFQKEVA